MPHLLAESYFHTIDPFAIHIYGDFGLRWYGISYAVGFLLGWVVLRWMAKTNRSPLTTEQVGDLMFYMIAGVLIGGRLGYAIFYLNGAPFITFTKTLPFWDLLAIHLGGMSVHGGILGVMVACWIFARRRQVSALHLFDLGSWTCTFGLGLGRLANFVNGELPGRALPDQTNPPAWSMKFPQEMREWLPREPRAWNTEALSKIGEAVERVSAISAVEWPLFLQAAVRDGEAEQAVRGAVKRLIRAVWDGNQAVVDGLRPALTACYPSQLFQALTDGPILFGLLAVIWLKPRKPGVVGSWFLILYGILRIITEKFRQPDVPTWLGLSRGQQLSVLMVVIGAGLLVWLSRRDVDRISGLRKA